MQAQKEEWDVMQSKLQEAEGVIAQERAAKVDLNEKLQVCCSRCLPLV